MSNEGIDVIVPIARVEEVSQLASIEAKWGSDATVARASYCAIR
jgi:hypothetical protein